AERALKGTRTLYAVRRERVGGHAHHLEEHEQVEEIAAEREPAESAEKDKEQRVKEGPLGVEVTPGEEQGGRNQHPSEGCQSGAERIEGSRDPNHGAALKRPPIAQVRDKRTARAARVN